MNDRLIIVPPVFMFDHWSRDLPEVGTWKMVGPTIGRRDGRLAVEMDDDAIRDLYTDAIHYSDAGIARDMGMPGLATSARAVVKALRDQAADVTDAVDADSRARGWS